jgi:hypothetical protein
VPLRGRDTFGGFVPSKLAFPSSTIRSARAELAVLRDTLPPSRTRSEKSRAIASLFSCQRTFSPRPAERPHLAGHKTKNPASSAGFIHPHTCGMNLLDARLLSILYS